MVQIIFQLFMWFSLFLSHTHSHSLEIVRFLLNDAIFGVLVSVFLFCSNLLVIKANNICCSRGFVLHEMCVCLYIAICWSSTRKKGRVIFVLFMFMDCKNGSLWIRVIHDNNPKKKQTIMSTHPPRKVQNELNRNTSKAWSKSAMPKNKRILRVCVFTFFFIHQREWRLCKKEESLSHHSICCLPL